jgi:hypothetical protein
MTGNNRAALREPTAEMRMRDALARKIFRKLDDPLSVSLLRFAWLADRALHLLDQARNRWGDAEEMTDEEHAIITNGDAS